MGIKMFPIYLKQQEVTLYKEYMLHQKILRKTQHEFNLKGKILKET